MDVRKFIMKVHDYIKYYKESVPLDLCEAIKEYRYNYKPSTYSNNKGKVNNSEERVRMDEYWVRKNNQYYDEIKAAFEWVIKKYSEEYDIKSQNWHFLTSDEKTVFNLANSGFNIFAAINPEVAGGFEHQGYFALIDKRGYLRSRVDNFDNPIVYYSGVDKGEDNVNDVDILIEDINILLKE